MKTKSYLFAAASALMLASCTQNEVVDIPATKAIGFGTYVGNTSRAAAEESTVENLKDPAKGNGFYVFGSYMDNSAEVIVFKGNDDQSHVKFEGAAWGYTPQNYWSVGKPYKFAAYGPAAALDNGTKTFSYDDNTLSVKNFEAKGDIDLVVAEGDADGYTVADENATPEKIQFKFFHALSKVRFTFVNGWRNLVTVKVSDVKLTGVKRTGDLTTTGTLANATAPFAIAHWTNQAVKPENNDYSWSDEFETQTTSDSHPYEYFFIPQALEAQQVALSFSCLVTNNQGSGPDLGEGAGRPVSVTVNIPVDVVNSWEPGTAYNYTLTIDGKLFGLLPIEFDNIQVTDWENGNGDDLNRDDVTE